MEAFYGNIQSEIRESLIKEAIKKGIIININNQYQLAENKKYLNKAEVLFFRAVFYPLEENGDISSLARLFNIDSKLLSKGIYMDKWHPYAVGDISDYNFVNMNIWYIREYLDETVHMETKAEIDIEKSAYYIYDHDIEVRYCDNLTDYLPFGGWGL